jgi:hypothetical protein
MFHRNICVSIIVLAMVAAIPAHATAIQWYFDRATWEAATASRFTVDFDTLGLTAGQYTDVSTNPGFTFGGADFTNLYGTTTRATMIGNAVPGEGFLAAYGTGAYIRGDQSFGPGVNTFLRVRLASAKQAAGADFATGIGSPYAGTPVKVKLSTGDEYTLPTNSTPVWAFLGFTSDTPITSLEIRAATTDAWTFVDNFTYGDGYVPEPTPDLDTLILCGTGLAILSFAARLRKRLSS